METYMGTIMLWAPQFAPSGWMFCQGQLLSVAQFTALFSLLGNTYGGNGQTTFALPDLRGRLPLGPGQQPGGTNYQLGQVGGTESVSLTIANLAPHAHSATISDPISVKASSQPATQQVPGTSGATTLAAGVANNRPAELYNNATPDVTLNTGGGSGNINVGITGNGQPFGVVQPYLGINFIICVEGLYPPRP